MLIISFFLREILESEFDLKKENHSQFFLSSLQNNKPSRKNNTIWKSTQSIIEKLINDNSFDCENVHELIHNHCLLYQISSESNIKIL